MAHLDLMARDPKNLNYHIEVQFEDVLGEPEGIKSHEYVWYNAYQMFSNCRACCYGLLTLCCGLCIGAEWGLQLACVTFRHVWCFTPCLRTLAITCGTLQRCCGNAVNCCLEPPCSASAWLFSNIRIKG